MSSIKESVVNICDSKQPYIYIVLRSVNSAFEEVNSKTENFLISGASVWV